MILFDKKRPIKVILFDKNDVIDTFRDRFQKKLTSSISFSQKQPPEVFCRKRCFPVNFGKFLRAPFLKNTSGALLLFSFPGIPNTSFNVYFFVLEPVEFI